jgi:hypothetical protein
MRTWCAEQPTARSAEARRALGRTLLQQGISVRDDPALAYVFWEEAREVAIGVGDMETALRAVDHWEANYDMEVWPLRVETLRKLIRYTEPLDGLRELLNTADELSDDALQEGEYEVAKELIGLAIDLARRLEQTSVVQRLGQKRAEIRSVEVSSPRPSMPQPSKPEPTR